MNRKKPPDRRAALTQKVVIERQSYYLTLGEYEDGSLAEVFVTASKEGTSVRGMLDALSRTISIALQCGAAVDSIVKALRHLNFPPHGEVKGSPHVKRCSSIPDYVAQEIEWTFLKAKSEEATSPKEEKVG